MAEIIYGKPIAERINAETRLITEKLAASGHSAVLATVRLGEDPGTCSYEQSISRRCEAVGIVHKKTVLETSITRPELEEVISSLGCDDSVSGIMIFTPLPRELKYQSLKELIPASKDVDGVTSLSYAGVFAGTHTGFCPCTAQSAMALLDSLGIDCAGKRAAVVGRSLTSGKPAAMLLLERNATVTVCHTKTLGLDEILKNAEIIVTCAGVPGLVGKESFAPGQVIIDVGTGFDPAAGKIRGDADFESALQTVAAISPVPGGTGTVTTAILMHHTALAAQAICGE